jgi:hypothetical protein
LGLERKEGESGSSENIYSPDGEVPRRRKLRIGRGARRERDKMKTDVLKQTILTAGNWY